MCMFVCLPIRMFTMCMAVPTESRGTCQLPWNAGMGVTRDGALSVVGTGL